MTVAVMLSPVANQSFSTTSGNVYRSDQFGIISNVQSQNDITDLTAQGCVLLSPPPTNLFGKLLGADFNVTTDQIIAIGAKWKWRPTKIVVLNTTVPGMNTAVGGIYTAAAKAGSQIVAATQVYTGLTDAYTALELTLNAPTLVLPVNSSLYFSLSTAQGVAAKADIYVFGENYPMS